MGNIYQDIPGLEGMNVDENGNITLPKEVERPEGAKRRNAKRKADEETAPAGYKNISIRKQTFLKIQGLRMAQEKVGVSKVNIQNIFEAAVDKEISKDPRVKEFVEKYLEFMA